MAEQPTPRKKKSPEPHHPAPYNESVMANVKALFADATYAVALNWILVDLCRMGDMTFRVGDGIDSQRLSDFAEGKRFVASQIVKMTRLRPPGPREQP